MPKYPVLALIALVATVADAASLPLKPGTYVLDGTACKEPPLATLFHYDGRAFSYPHATQCRSSIATHSGKTYRIAETCSALGDGTPTKPDTLHATYTIRSHTTVAVSRPTRKGSLAYRWCGA